MDSRGGGSLISRPYRRWLVLVLRTEARLRSGERDRIFSTRESADAESVGRSTTSPASTDRTGMNRLPRRDFERKREGKPTVFIEHCLRPNATPGVEGVRVEVPSNEEVLRFPPVSAGSFPDDHGWDRRFGLCVGGDVEKSLLPRRSPKGVAVQKLLDAEVEAQKFPPEYNHGVNCHPAIR